MRQIEPIARIHTDFTSKFGIPRQAGIIDALKGTVVFEPKYRDANALKGLEGFSRLWLIWEFSESVLAEWSPTVKPPRLGGNTRMGVFATRSPFRPNPLGLSCVKLEGIEPGTPEGPVLHVAGADMMDGTPIYDIKPYLPYADSFPDARGGFTDGMVIETLDVDFPDALLAQFPADRRAALVEVLRQDPRPGYRHGDDGRRYGVEFAGFDVRFTVRGGVLRVTDVVPLAERR